MPALSAGIDAIRVEMGGRLIILGHYYQRASVLRHADISGDSLELARAAARASSAEKVVLCGVRFMAESADILTGPGQTVYMPDIRAGCPMADMTDVSALRAAWATVVAAGGKWVPVAYVNSSAAVKAFCGRNGGSTCTSSNAARVFNWALGAGRRVLFVPDEHLGRNTARDIGIANLDVGLYDPLLPGGGLAESELKRARLVVWKGFCLVHTAFTESDVLRVREQIPGARIIVHPETPASVVALADAHGSTSQIIKYVAEAPDGATVVIGTELNLIESLAEQHRGRITVKALGPSVCANMARTREENLLQLLETWPDDHAVRVPPDIAGDARVALERMLTL